MHVSQSGQNCKPDGEKLEFWATEAPEMRSVGWSEVSARRPEAQNRTPSAALTQRAAQTRAKDRAEWRLLGTADASHKLRHYKTIKGQSLCNLTVLLVLPIVVSLGRVLNI